MIDKILNCIRKPEPKAFDQESARRMYPCVHLEDLCPVSLIAPDLSDGPWIAGGSALAWYQGEPVGFSDIDVFCSSEEQANRVIANIDSSYTKTIASVDLADIFASIGVSSSVVYKSKNAVTLRLVTQKAVKGWTIQVITKHYFDSLNDVIDTFDITVCQIGSDGAKFLLGDDVAQHIRNRELHFRKPYQPDIVKRLVKYWSYGYEPDVNLISEITNNESSHVKWLFNREEEEYENAFNIR